MAQPFRIPRIAQITDAHCGPAVIQMLMSHLGLQTTQQDITKSIGITRTIRYRGTRVDQLSQAVDKISFKNIKLWYKDHAKLSDIEQIINNYHLPAVIEWQGLFGYKINPKTGRKIQYNDSHYSIVTHIDPISKQVTLIDPYRDFIKQDRDFSYNQFRKRWWDVNIYVTPDGESVNIYDYKLFFFLAPKQAEFPKSLKLKSGSEYLESLPL